MLSRSHAVWLKNRTPARALRKKDAKTPYEALKGAKPTLTRERIWGSRAYVTYPPEFRTTTEMTKLHSPCGWLGYFVGCESEAMYHIYSPEKHKVYRIGVARVEDGKVVGDTSWRQRSRKALVVCPRRYGSQGREYNQISYELFNVTLPVLSCSSSRKACFLSAPDANGQHRDTS
jgi:hypothetical protein